MSTMQQSPDTTATAPAGGALEFASLFTPQGLADPHTFFHRLRSEDPVHWDKAQSQWVFTRYADCVALLHDPRLSPQRYLSPEQASALGLGSFAELYRIFGTAAPFRDAPDHGRIRSLINKGFLPSMVEGMRAQLLTLVDEMLDAVAARGQMDLIKDLAYPFPAIVISRMLGVPEEDREQFQRWSEDFVRVTFGLSFKPEEMPQLIHSGHEYISYVRRLIAERRVRPRNDILSAFVHAEAQGGWQSEEELIGNALVLLTGGHETTTNLIGNGVVALLRHPEQFQRLRANPEIMPTAIEELLRYAVPGLGTRRQAKEDLEVGGKLIRKGEYLTLLTMAANRDPARFPDPDRLDLARQDNRHIAFGFGSHFCVGAPLVRLEAQAVFGALLRRLPRLRLASEQLEWVCNFPIYGVRSLPVEF